MLAERPAKADATLTADVEIGPTGARLCEESVGRTGGHAMAMIEIGDKDDVVVVSFTTVKILDHPAIDQVREEFKDLTLQAASGPGLGSLRDRPLSRTLLSGPVLPG